MLPTPPGKKGKPPNAGSNLGPFEILQGIMSNPNVKSATIKATASMYDGSKNTTWAGLDDKGKKHLFQSTQVPKLPR